MSFILVFFDSQCRNAGIHAAKRKRPHMTDLANRACADVGNDINEAEQD